MPITLSPAEVEQYNAIAAANPEKTQAERLCDAIALAGERAPEVTFSTTAHTVEAEITIGEDTYGMSMQMAKPDIEAARSSLSWWAQCVHAKHLVATEEGPALTQEEQDWYKTS